MNSEHVILILHTFANPIRKDAIEALRGGGMRFSQLLATCGLDYDHDTRHFYYHLSNLMKERITKKVGEVYFLTETLSAHNTKVSGEAEK